MQILINKIFQRCNDFYLTNEKRAQTFFNQLRTDCLQKYTEKMHKIFVDEETILKEADLLGIHNTAMNQSMELVCSIFDF